MTRNNKYKALNCMHVQSCYHEPCGQSHSPTLIIIIQNYASTIILYFVNNSAAIACSNLPPPTNGIITFSAGTSTRLPYLSTATYGCSIGYGLFGGDTTRSCVQSSDSGGEWNGTAPVCDGEYACIYAFLVISTIIIFMAEYVFFYRSHVF